MKNVLGAGPMPTVKRRRSPTSSCIEAQDRVLVADGAVGQEHDLAQHRGVARRRPARARAPAASRCRRARAGRRRTASRARASPRRAATGAAKSGVVDRIEFDDVEPIARLQPIERQQQRVARLHDRHAFHRARRVDDVRDLARRARGATASRTDGGSAISSAYVLPPFVSVKSAAPGAAPTSGVHASSKSRAAGTGPSASVRRKRWPGCSSTSHRVVGARQAARAGSRRGGRS